MGEPHPGRIFGQPHGQVSIGEWDSRVIRGAHPRPQVHLVHRDGGVQRIAPCPFGHPPLVPPVVAEVPDDRGGLRRHLAEEGERVGLLHPVASVT